MTLSRARLDQLEQAATRAGETGRATVAVPPVELAALIDGYRRLGSLQLWALERIAADTKARAA